MFDTLDHVKLSRVVIQIALISTTEKINNDLYIKDLSPLEVSGREGMNLWLTDQIMNRTCNILNTDALNNGDTYYIMDSYFYSFLSNMKGRPKNDIINHDNVKNWFKSDQPTKQKDKVVIKLFNRKIIFIPIHVTNHWIVYIIFFESNMIICLDSGKDSPTGKLGDKDRRKFEEIFKWMNIEHQHQFGGNDHYYNRDDWTFRFFQNNPRQLNGKDCGVFVLATIIRVIFDGNLDNIRQHVTQNKMPDYRRIIASVLGIHYNIIDQNGVCLLKKEVIYYTSNYDINIYYIPHFYYR